MRGRWEPSDDQWERTEPVLRPPIWPASCAATSMPIPPMPDLSSGSTQTRFAASALTNSLRQSTSMRKFVLEVVARFPIE
jgi:hypothetical protein